MWVKKSYINPNYCDMSKLKWAKITGVIGVLRESLSSIGLMLNYVAKCQQHG